jgi:hypothetical protein
MFTNVMVATWSNGRSSLFSAGAWSKTIVIVTLMTLWVICLAVCAMSTIDFVFIVELPPSLPFKFCVFTSQMDLFATNHLSITFKWHHYCIEMYLGRCTLAHPASDLPASASGIRSAMPSESLVLEYASISAGGRVIQSLTSDTYSHSTWSLHNPFAISLWGSEEKARHSPAVTLMDGMNPGECWALHGDFGQIGIQFMGAVRLSSLVVGHANISSTASAPKKFVLWGLKSTDNSLCDTPGDEGILTWAAPKFGPRY